MSDEEIKGLLEAAHFFYSKYIEVETNVSKLFVDDFKDHRLAIARAQKVLAAPTPLIAESRK